MKFGRTWLMLALAMVMVLSVTGGTIAWFTDSAESTGNTIQAGTLDVVLSASDMNGTYEEIKEGSAPLFGEEHLWEPGYTAAKKVKIENNGNLAFKYMLNVKPAMSPEFADENSTLLKDTETLAKEIEVWLAPVQDTAYATFADLKAAGQNVGTLYDLAMASMEDTDGAAYGVMLPEGKEIPNGAPDYVVNTDIEYVLALHMKETAGNECQNLSISDGFVIDLRATQYNYEADSFGTDYDANVEYDDLPVAFVKKLSDEELEAIEDVDLDVGYMFSTTDASAEGNSYAKWHADFEISFDKPVAASTLAIAGQYDGFSENWLVIELNNSIIDEMKEQGIITDANATAIPANTPIRLLKFGGTMMNHSNPYMNYEELCAGVVKFMCGAYAMDEAAASGTTMSVKLNIYETVQDENGIAPDGNKTDNYESDKVMTLGSYSYTF